MPNAPAWLPAWLTHWQSFCVKAYGISTRVQAINPALFQHSQLQKQALNFTCKGQLNKPPGKQFQCIDHKASGLSNNGHCPGRRACSCRCNPAEDGDSVAARLRNVKVCSELLALIDCSPHLVLWRDGVLQVIKVLCDEKRKKGVIDSKPKTEVERRKTRVTDASQNDAFHRLWQQLTDLSEVLLIRLLGGYIEMSLQLLLIPATISWKDDPTETVPVLMAYFIPIKAFVLQPVDACMPYYRQHCASWNLTHQLEFEEWQDQKRKAAAMSGSGKSSRRSSCCKATQLGIACHTFINPHDAVEHIIVINNSVDKPSKRPINRELASLRGMSNSDENMTSRHAKRARVSASGNGNLSVSDGSMSREPSPVATAIVRLTSGFLLQNGMSKEDHKAYLKKLYEAKEYQRHAADSVKVQNAILDCIAAAQRTRNGHWLNDLLKKYPEGCRGLPAGVVNLDLGPGVDLMQAWPPFVYVHGNWGVAHDSEQANVPRPQRLPDEFVNPCYCKVEPGCELKCCQGKTARKVLHSLRFKGLSHKLIIQLTPGKGMGVFAKQRIEPKSYICEYAGMVHRGSEAEDVELQHHLDAWHYTFCMPNTWQGQRKLSIVDATFVGNIARFINHSCNPNVAVVSVCQPHDQQAAKLLMLMALRPIEVGEELSFSYTDRTKVLDPSKVAERAKCYCAEPTCAGYMFPLKKGITRPGDRDRYHETESADSDESSEEWSDTSSEAEATEPTPKPKVVKKETTPKPKSEQPKTKPEQSQAQHQQDSKEEDKKLVAAKKLIGGPFNSVGDVLSSDEEVVQKKVPTAYGHALFRFALQGNKKKTRAAKA